MCVEGSVHKSDRQPVEEIRQRSRGLHRHYGYSPTHGSRGNVGFDGISHIYICRFCHYANVVFITLCTLMQDVSVMGSCDLEITNEEGINRIDFQEQKSRSMVILTSKLHRYASLLVSVTAL